jgi:tetraacyldisaccharide 4'-kinase
MIILKALFLYPLSLIYAFVVSIRNTLFDLNILKSEEFDIPVISVGNITVGGTGKTPTVEYLITLLRNKYKIAVLSRGYKRKTKGFIIADETATVQTIGDESMQIYLKFPDVTVAVNERRVAGIKKLMESGKEIELIILDDAFQHRYVKPGLSILLIDYTQPLTGDYYLPYGRLRDQPSQRDRAEIILITKSPENIKPIDMRLMATDLTLKPYQSLFFSSIEYKGLMPVFDNELFALDAQELKSNNYGILVVTGIGNPKPLINYCKSITDNISVLNFPDHHQYEGKDLKKIKERFSAIENKHKIIVTTEKDAIRLKNRLQRDDELKRSLFFYPIEMKILNEEKTEMDKLILNYVKIGKDQYRFLTTKRQY